MTATTKENPSQPMANAGADAEIAIWRFAIEKGIAITLPSAEEFKQKILTDSDLVPDATALDAIFSSLGPEGGLNLLVPKELSEEFETFLTNFILESQDIDPEVFNQWRQKQRI